MPTDSRVVARHGVPPLVGTRAYGQPDDQIDRLGCAKQWPTRVETISRQVRRLGDKELQSGTSKIGAE